MQPVSPKRQEFAAPSRREEMVDALSHGGGLIASLAGVAVLVVAAATRGDAWHVVASCVFGSSLVLLYAASTLYHSDLPASAGPGSELVYAASWFMGNSFPGTMISGAGGR